MKRDHLYAAGVSVGISALIGGSALFTYLTASTPSAQGCIGPQQAASALIRGADPITVVVPKTTPPAYQQIGRLNIAGSLVASFDMDGSRSVDLADALVSIQHFGESDPLAIWNTNGDGGTDFKDTLCILCAFGWTPDAIDSKCKL